MKNLLRFITAGSVDDGKSTLIGRILYDAQGLLSDQVAALHAKSADGDLDLASLTDGLAAEREQGITIDVAYRYFSTPKRKFIIADAPGHEQYTRNMVTGASTADAAIVLIDATRTIQADGSVQLLPQTKRHSTILQRLDCPKFIVAVNKMDLLNYDQSVFDAIVAAYRDFAEQRGVSNVSFIPVSALKGDNIVSKSKALSWYDGEPLLTLLENLDIETPSQDDEQSLLLPVQLVVRQDGSSEDDFRGYQGKIEGGVLNVGQRIRVLPSQQTAVVTAIYGLDAATNKSSNGEQSQAKHGEVVTVVLDHDIDISRGDYLVAENSLLQGARELSADVCWLDNAPLNPYRKYLLKHTTQTVTARIKTVNHVLNVSDLSDDNSDRDSLGMNDIGQVTIKLQRPIAAQHYRDNHAAGAFILIDEVTNHTVAAGMIADFSADAVFAQGI